MGTGLDSYAASISTGNPGYATGNIMKMAFQKSDISVNLKDHYNAKVYTSLSPVVGNVTITTKRDVPFDSIQILLLGHTKTSFEGMKVPQEVVHTFLKMMMPIPESTYPVPRVLEAGRTYTIPFNFVIPSQLTISACNHSRLSDHMQDHHVRLPPSLGGWQRDDMAPDMARVEYSIRARVFRNDGDRNTRIMEGTHTIQVLPAAAEEPPLNITDKDPLYRMSKTKTLRRNILATKLGRLTAEAAQPSAAILSPDGRRVMSHPMARIQLVFHPESARTLPPTVTGVTAKVTSHTYFASGTISSFPNLGDWNAPYLLNRRGQYFTSTALPPVTLAEQPAWTPVPEVPITRRDSGYGGSEHPSSSSDDDDDGDDERTTLATKSKSSSSSSSPHTATLMVPLSLPTDKKTFVPTFHSCIASRVYTVQLSINLSSKRRGGGGASNYVSLVVPLQIAVDGVAASVAAAGSGDGQQEGGAVVVVAPSSSSSGLPSFEEAAADEHLRPRVLHVPGGSSVTGGREWMLAAAAAAAADEGQGGAGGRDWDGLPEYGEPGFRRVD
ncbi:hypothetical protein C8A00DRAFT_12288 [Chaetomidium leptoderma]|uniref:Bul1 C-terminal domain-containing protein n=1 Tax=Chaetomidium leptoderma TaxID=669021 RepID=A0AAN6VT86_9PEZI|nr:hypothetical protein C8A00DRAFT_12288 [Chaetomidium leptoderma]